MSRRAVITGMGIVAPNGIGVEAYWDATRRGVSGIKRISRFDPSKYPTQFAGEVDNFVVNDFVDQRLVVQTDRWTWFALAAAKMALEDARLDPSTREPYELSVITASGSGGNEFGQKEIQSLWAKGPQFVGAYQSIAWFYAASNGQISIKYGMKGPASVVIAEGAGALDALNYSRRVIRRGSNVVVSGGTEAPIGPYALVCQLRSGRLSSANSAEYAYRPFDAHASGFVPGEGGAILIVEELESAQARGAPQIYAEIAGHAATNDAYHPNKPSPDPRHYARAMSLAMKDAGVGPDEIDVVFADAAGVPELDALEVQALHQVFGERATGVPVTAPKSMVGRLYSGGAALDVATALLTMRDGVVPPTVNLTTPADGCDLAIVTGEAQPMDVNTVLVGARGFGGFNSAMVLKKFTG
jgi:3-oxoacyl-(acyl-carrier-protein) synthase